MKPVFFVHEDEANLARAMEKKLLALPTDSGILFVGVSVIQAEDLSQVVYYIWVGCSRMMDERVMDPLVRMALKDEVESGLRIVVEAHRGVGR